MPGPRRVQHKLVFLPTTWMTDGCLALSRFIYCPTSHHRLIWWITSMARWNRTDQWPAKGIPVLVRQTRPPSGPCLYLSVTVTGETFVVRLIESFSPFSSSIASSILWLLGTNDRLTGPFYSVPITSQYMSRAESDTLYSDPIALLPICRNIKR